MEARARATLDRGSELIAQAHSERTGHSSTSAGDTYCSDAASNPAEAWAEAAAKFTAAASQNGVSINDVSNYKDVIANLQARCKELEESITVRDTERRDLQEIEARQSQELQATQRQADDLTHQMEKLNQRLAFTMLQCDETMKGLGFNSPHSLVVTR